jgi:hypothetical protein
MRHRSTAPWFALLALAFSLIVAGHFSAEEEMVKKKEQTTWHSEPTIDPHNCPECHVPMKRGKRV